MPRTNRPHRRSASKAARTEADDAGESLNRLVTGSRRLQTRRGAQWHVQPVSAVQAVKTYVCPGCGQDVGTSVAHVVAWRADGVLGDEADIAARRHWHEQCWRIS